MNRLAKLLLVLSLAIMFAGIGLAVAQPGGLGDDDGNTGTARQAQTTSTTADDEVAAGPTSTEPSDTTAAGEPDETTTTEAPPTSEAPATDDPDDTTTTTVGSGIGADPGEVDDSDDLANTGGRSMILVGMVIGALGLVLRSRALRGTTATARLR